MVKKYASQELIISTRFFNYMRISNDFLKNKIFLFSFSQPAV